MRWFQRVIAAAVLSMSTVAAGVGASYGQDKVVRIGFQKYGKLVLLKGKGSLEAKLEPLGYKVAWTEFPSGPPLLEALNVGAIDFGITGEAPPIFAQAAGAPIQYLAYEPPAPKGEAILVPKDSKLKSVADLKGKKVALNKGSNVHYLLVKALEKAGAQVYRDRAGVPGAGRCPCGVRARRGRCLGNLGPVPGSGGSGHRRAHPDRWHRDRRQLSVLFLFEEVLRKRSEGRGRRARPN